MLSNGVQILLGKMLERITHARCDPHGFKKGRVGKDSSDSGMHPTESPTGDRVQPVDKPYEKIELFEMVVIAPIVMFEMIKIAPWKFQYLNEPWWV